MKKKMQFVILKKVFFSQSFLANPLALHFKDNL
jgi:hypothetical protein